MSSCSGSHNDVHEDSTTEFITEWPVVLSSEFKDSEKPNDKCYKQQVKRCIPFNEQGQGQEDLHAKIKRSHIVAKKSPHSDFEHLASVGIARWWRNQPAALKEQCRISCSRNPNTILRSISRLPITKDFINKEIRRLSIKLEWVSTADVHAALGSYQEMKNHFPEAIENLTKAVEKSHEEKGKEYKWLLHKMMMQYQIQKDQERALKQLNKTLENDLKLPTVQEVERVPCNDLSVEEFHTKYACLSKPVIITGLVKQMTTQPWTLEHIKNKADDCRVVLKHGVRDSCEWARLEEHSSTTVGTYIDKVLNGAKTESYLFDWSLPINCNQLAQELIIPKYFASKSSINN